jgi:hypothetical protein
MRTGLEGEDAMKRTGKRSALSFVADFGIVLLIALAIGLPLYIKWSGSKLSYMPEPEFPASRTNRPATGQK